MADNIRRLLETGAIGINFEDRIVQGEGLYSVAEQTARISAIRKAADDEGIPLFINARTDLFLNNKPKTHGEYVDQAITRAKAYEDAGADGFFVPGLADADMIRTITAATPLPVNVMIRGGVKSIADVQGLGASRFSFGPGPYATAMDDLTERFKAI